MELIFFQAIFGYEILCAIIDCSSHRVYPAVNLKQQTTNYNSNFLLRIYYLNTKVDTPISIQAHCDMALYCVDMLFGWTFQLWNEAEKCKSFGTGFQGLQKLSRLLFFKYNQQN